MKKIYYLVLLLSLAFYSCKDPDDLEDKKKITDKTFNMEFIEVLNTNSRFQHKFETRNTFVIKTKAEETDLFSNHLFDMTMPPTSALPEIDYENKMLLCIVYPMQTSGSNKLTITDVKMVEGIIEVSSELFVPGIGTDDIGMPVVFVEVDKYDNEVEFLPTKEIFAPVYENLFDKLWELSCILDGEGNTIDPNKYKNEETNGDEIKLNPFTIMFKDDNTFSGMSNCNNYGGNYSIIDSNLSISELWSTEVACPLSDFYQILLNNAVAIKYSSQKLLTITSKYGNKTYTMCYFYTKEGFENNLSGTNWILESYSIDGGISFNNSYKNEKNETIKFLDDKYTLEFTQDRVKGDANCSNYETHYYVYPSNLISLASFWMLLECGYNHDFFILILSSNSYEFEEGSIRKLKLFDESKNKIVVFREQ